MPLVNLKDLLHHAHAHRYAVAAFEVAGLEFLAGYLQAAEHSRAPIVLGIPAANRAGVPPEILLPAVEAAARLAQTPVALMFDHAHSLAEAERGIRLGCNGVMIDGSELGLSANVALTSEAVRMAHGCDIPVEAELGCVPEAGGGVRYTSVEEAKAFVERTGVDFLAVAIGTVHGRLPDRSGSRPKLDATRLRQVNEALGIPLVIHGGTGLGEAQLQRLVANGAAKINFFTALDEAAGSAIDPQPGRFTQRRLPVAERIAAEAERYIRWCGAAGRAAEVLVQCRPWEPVEHLIIYNLATGFDHKADELMAKGREVLATIPGVRAVLTGRAVQQDAKFRLCWLVRFASPAVIASYRDHPTHVAFADRHFRPLAEERISIDFRLIAG